MDSNPAVVLFAPASSPHSDAYPGSGLGAGLRAYGFAVTACADSRRLPVHVQDFGRLPGCLVLGGSLAQNCAAAASARALAPSLGILALVSSTDEEHLLPIMRSGVDTYCPDSASARLVAAAVAGVLQRVRLFSSAARPIPQWELRNHGWVLASPGGKRMPLTTGERAFLVALMGAPGCRACHADLIAAVGSAYGSQAPEWGRPRLGVLLARMRQKVQSHGETLPLKSVHGWGYMFTTRDPSG